MVKFVWVFSFRVREYWLSNESQITLRGKEVPIQGLQPVEENNGKSKCAYSTTSKIGQLDRAFPESKKATLYNSLHQKTRENHCFYALELLIYVCAQK